MFNFGLKQTQVWVIIALVLCSLVRNHSGYPQAEEDTETEEKIEENAKGQEDGQDDDHSSEDWMEDTSAVDKNQDDDANPEAVQAEDENWEDEDLEDEVINVEGATSPTPDQDPKADCLKYNQPCRLKKKFPWHKQPLPCCGVLECRLLFKDESKKRCLSLRYDLT